MMGAPEPDAMPAGKGSRERAVVVAVSGGPDSVYLLRKKLSGGKGTRVTVGHVNYGTRGKDSEKDHLLVDEICNSFGIGMTVLKWKDKMNRGGRARNLGRFPPGFENRARDARYRFLKDLSEKVGAEAIALAHTADDQVETILMRVFEGAGIAGLKGIPREIEGGIERPILDVWKEDIVRYLKKNRIRYRIDRSNFDTRFERNWIRHVLIPLLVKRYGKAVKKRIFTLGERFRELDDYLETEAGRWIRRNLKLSSGGKANRSGSPQPGNAGPGQESRGGFSFRRKTFSALPSALRVKILQRICFDRLGVAPNERLLKAMDKSVSTGSPSASVNAGKGWKLANLYEEALFVQGEISHGRRTSPPIMIAAPGEYDIPFGQKSGIVTFAWEAGEKIPPAQAKRLAAIGDAEVFDAAGLTLPLTVRPLRAGDRIRPFGSDAGGNARDGEKKVKEILIDRKIPRDDRWGRPVLCDAEGAILWIPGVLRSAHAPVTPETRKTALLRIRASK
ncbi:MAG: tRNA lysidine(34) synthetase TilS [Deltaproteobacteria bacterium CG2_30_66_27]|nr:MAG: tRNA lysidine(34) synthetase TilS [Deltaproteobacteria bacterium CG2_30_66_27]